MTGGSFGVRFGGGGSGPKGSSSSTVGSTGVSARPPLSDLAEFLATSLEGALIGEWLDTLIDLTGTAGGPVRGAIFGGFTGECSGDRLCGFDGEFAAGGPAQLLLLVVSLCGMPFGSSLLGLTSSNTSSSAQYWYQ